MKKKLLIIACLLLLLAANALAQIKTDWEEMCLKGKVKSLKETEYYISSKDSVDCAALYAAFLKCELDYDKLISLVDSVCGDKIKHYDRYYEFDSLGHYVIPWEGTFFRYQYDNQGKMLEKIIEVDGAIIDTLFYSYNEQGMLTNQRRGKTITTFVYDKRGNIVEKTTKIGDSVVGFFKIKYDRRGRERMRKEFTTHDEVFGRLSRSISKKDSKGNLIYELDESDKPYKYRKKIQYVYDKNDSIVMARKMFEGYDFVPTLGDCNYRQILDSNGVVTNVADYKYEVKKHKTISRKRTVFERDSHGCVTKFEEYYGKESSPESIRKYEYDDKGRKTEELSERYNTWDNSISRRKYVWEYDEKGNNTKHSGFFGENLEHEFDTYCFFDNEDNFYIGFSNDYLKGSIDGCNLLVRKIEYY